MKRFDLVSLETAFEFFVLFFFLGGGEAVIELELWKFTEFLAFWFYWIGPGVNV